MKQLKTNDLTALGALMARKERAAVSEAYNDRVRKGQASKAAPQKAPVAVPLNTLTEKRRRQENANKINKLRQIITRNEPRLFMEVLQDFGSIEGLSAPKQEELLKRLEKIKKDYRL